MDLARDLVDHQLADRDGVACGRVDDVVLRWTEDGAEVGELLSGGAVVLDQMGRLGRLLRPLIRSAGGRRRVQIEWSLIGRFEPDRVHVVAPREALGLTEVRS